MTETERLRWIDLVAQAVQIIIRRDSIRNGPSAQHWAQAISLMASMPQAWIENNIEQFREIETHASAIVRLEVKTDER